MARIGNALMMFLAVAVGQTACFGNRIRPEAPPVAPATAPTESRSDSILVRALAMGQETSRPIGPRDLLDVSVFEAPELSRIVRVSEAGDVSLPLLGAIQAAGKTARELEVLLQDTLRSRYMRDPRVTVDVKEAAAQPIYVLGEVQQPGAYVAGGTDRLTVLRAVAVARGLRPGSHRRAIVIRAGATGEQVQIPIDLDNVVKGKTPDLMLEPNDVVYVPKNSERAVALGVVDALMRAVTFRAVF